MNQPTYNPAVFKEFEHAGWEEISKTYRETSEKITGQVAAALLDAAVVKRATRLLDVACGTGRVAAEAHRRGAEVLGVDFSAGMVAEAFRHRPEILFRQADAEALPLDDESFDAVVCAFGILHFSRPNVAIREAFRVLAPGGRLAFTAWAPADRSPFFGLVMQAVAAHGVLNSTMPAGPPENFGDPETCREVLHGAGFANAEISEIPVHFAAGDGAEVIEAMSKGSVRGKALLETQTPEAREKIGQAIFEGARAFLKNGRIAVPMPAVLARAHKP
ncbi:MAG: class I SAM-dependent methyltransferase [SAR324 cluster bacterium]|nr:class I SAM-dependent methyltransferase [SAR324 cluster bacterium]